MCSIHTIDTPPVADLLIVSTSSSTSASVSPPAISSSSSTRRLRGQRPGELEALAVEQRQRAGEDVGLVDHPGPFAAPSTAASSFDAGRPSAAPNVLPTSTFSNTVKPSNGRGICAVRPMPRWHRTWAGKLGDVLPAEDDAAAVGPQVAGDQVEQRRLARAVRPDDAESLTLGNVEREVSTTCKRAEALARRRRLAAVPSCRHGDDVSRAASACHRWGSPATASCW